MAMSLPVIIIFFCFHTIPLFCGFFYSLTNSKGFGVYDIIGLKNYTPLYNFFIKKYRTGLSDV